MGAEPVGPALIGRRGCSPGVTRHSLSGSESWPPAVQGAAAGPIHEGEKQRCIPFIRTISGGPRVRTSSDQVMAYYSDMPSL